MQKQLEPGFPAHSTVANHFRTNDDLASALRSLAKDDQQWSDLSEFLAPEPAAKPKITESSDDGLVYLLKSGKHYKIGRSEDIERRFREVKIALPEAVTLVHAIRTDDAPGIEAYWHRRFASKRANGEWFELSGEDVRAFCRRKFQ